MDAFFSELWMILVESSVWLIVGFAIAGAVHAIIPREWMLRHLSGRGIWPIAKASMLGIPLPLCSCSVIPVAAGLRQEGASKGASAAFAISTPQTGEESIPITWALFGPVYAFTRPVVAVITGLIAGVLIELTTKREEDDSVEDRSEPDPGAISLSITNAEDAGRAVESIESRASTSGSCCASSTPEPASSCCGSAPTRTQHSVGGKLRSGITHGFKTMPVDLAIWLVVGILLAAVIGAFIPASFFTEYAGDGIGAKFVMLLVGIPLYICATSSTPLAWSLVAAGLSPGAALVMLLSGPATNVATMSWIIKDLGMKALVIYLVVIAVVALSAGILFDATLAGFVQIADAATLHDHTGSFGVKEVAAVLFVMLMAWALGMKLREYMNQKGWGTTASTPTPGSCCSSKPTETSCGCSEA
jgi:uncharacterized membrane protein YraQ (UPF0718 family)